MTREELIQWATAIIQKYTMIGMWSAKLAAEEIVDRLLERTT